METQGFYHLGFDTSWLDELLKCRSVNSGEWEFKLKLRQIYTLIVRKI